MEQRNLSVGGSLVERRLSKSLRRDLYDGLANLGLSSYMPEAPTPLACLRAVLLDVYPPPEKGIRHIVQPAKNGESRGYAVVAAEAGDAHAGDGWGTVIVTAKLHKETGDMELDPWNSEKYHEIRDRMANLADWLDGAAVGSLLNRLSEEPCDGTPLPARGTHWIRDEYFERFSSIATVFEAASVADGEDCNKVYPFSVVADEHMLRAVGDALTEEIMGELAGIEAEIASGNLKEEACLTRLRAVGKLEAKVKRYEDAYATPYTVLQDAVRRTGQAVAQATMMASAAAVS